MMLNILMNYSNTLPKGSFKSASLISYKLLSASISNR